MMSNLIALCLRRRWLILVIALLLVGFGGWCGAGLPVEAYPDTSPVAAQVITQVHGLAAEEVEQQITIPLERVLAGAPQLVSMRSSSTFGLSVISLVFADGAEDYWVRQRVRERIAEASLPPGASADLDSVTGGTGEIFDYTLESDTKNLMELSEIQYWTVIPALQQVQGLAEVTNFGGFTKQFQLELDPAQLEHYAIGFNDVVAAINNNSANAGGGRVARGEQQYIIRGIGLVRSLDDFGAIAVATRKGVPVLIRDLGQLHYSHQEREGIVGKNGNPDTIEGEALMLKYQNPSEVLDRIHAKVAELNQQLSSQDVRLVPFIDQSLLIKATLAKVSHAVLEGVGLVSLILILFLGSPRSAFVVATTIPLALTLVFIVMRGVGASANLFSVGTIDFGVIVDGAIVVTEAILRQREAQPDHVLTEALVVRVVAPVTRPIIFAGLIIMTAYFPLFAFQGAAAKLVAPIVNTVSFAVLGALLATVTVIPGLAYLALKRPRTIFRNRLLIGLEQGYRASLRQVLRVPVLAFGFGAAALLAMVVLGMMVGREFMPELDEGALWLQVSLPSGISLDKASDYASELRRILTGYPEIADVVTQVGRSDDGTDPFTPSHLEIPVGLKPYETWPAHESRADFVARLNHRLSQLPGISVGISQPISDTVNDVAGGSHSPLTIRVYGEDFTELRRIGGDIVASLNAVPGTEEAAIFTEPPIPQIVIEIDRDALARYGVAVTDIASLIQNGIGGGPVSQIYIADRVYNLTVRFPRDARNSPESLGRLCLTSASGAQIPLAELAHIRFKTGESTITHEMNHRELTLRVEYGGRDLASYYAAARAAVANSVAFDPAKFHVEWAGQFREQQQAETRMILILLLVLALMLVLLYAGFGNFRHALLIMGIVPLAMLGGLVALVVTGTTLNVASAIGFIALFGVAVQNGIIMVAKLNQSRVVFPDLTDAILAGAAERFRPVLMTATVATVGMLPAALASGVGTDVQRAVAIVVAGGLLLATLLTLYLVPAMYFLLERRFAAGDAA